MPDGITCERVEREELDLRYVRGTLPEPLAEAFEAHYFGCDQCWALVRGSNEVRAAGPSLMASRWRRPWTLALAALLVGAVGVGFWRLSQTAESGVSMPSLERGGTAAAIVLSAAIVDRQVVAHWSRVPNAASYRVRFFGADGALLLQRQTPDTALMIVRDSLGVSPGGGRLLWQVQALDRLGGEISRSGLVEVP